MSLVATQYRNLTALGLQAFCCSVRSKRAGKPMETNIQFASPPTASDETMTPTIRRRIEDKWARSIELSGVSDDAFDDFDEDDFDDDFDDDFEEEVEGEYEIQDDEYSGDLVEIPGMVPPLKPTDNDDDEEEEEDVEAEPETETDKKKA